MPRYGWLAAGVVLGCLAASAGVAGPPLAAVAGAVVVAALALRAARIPGRTAAAGSGATVLLVSVGLLAASVRIAAATPDGQDPAALPGGAGPWSATVSAVSTPLEGRQRAVLRLDDPAGLVVVGSLPPYPEVAPGDRVRLGGRLRATPEGDYGLYLERIGASATLQATDLTRLPTPADPTVTLEGVRRRSADALAAALPEPAAGLAAGILVGLRDRVDRELAGDFTTAGISHVVAISGWNIAIVAATIGALAGRLSRRRRSIVTLAAIGLYVAFVGASASVLRAAAMAGVALLARETGRPGRAAAALAWAVAGLLLVDPGLVADPGFQLSALATAGLIAWSRRLAERLAGPAPGRVRGYLAEALGVSLAAQAATLPVVVAEFGRLSLVAPAVNLVVVPLVAPAMALGLIALLAGWTVLLGAPTALGTLLGLPAWATFELIISSARAGAGVPFASLELGEPWAGAVGLGLGIGLVLLAFGRRRLAGVASAARRALATTRASDRPARRRRRPAGRLVALAIAGGATALGLVLGHRPDGVPRVVVLDVGQGDAILVEGSRGGRLLVDGGPDPARLLVALDERLPPWDRRIDVVILTHPHEDHVAGLPRLLERYRVGRVFEPGMVGPGPGYAAWREALSERGPPSGTLARGDRLRVDEIDLTVLWPERGGVPREPADDGTAINNVSIVLLGEVAGRRFLLTGDVEQDVDPRLLAAALPPLDLLKVAHHGSRTATTDAFLEAVKPAVAIVSAGRDNPYGHPSPATLARLRDAGARVYRTDRDGTVEVAFEPGRITVRSGGPRTVDAPAARTAFTCGLPSPTAREPRPAPLPSAR